MPKPEFVQHVDEVTRALAEAGHTEFATNMLEFLVMSADLTEEESNEITDKYELEE